MNYYIRLVLDYIHEQLARKTEVLESSEDEYVALAQYIAQEQDSFKHIPNSLVRSNRYSHHT